MSEHILNIRSNTHRPDGSPLQVKKYDVEHTTTYEYTNTVENSTHTIRLQPKEDLAQDVMRSEISVSVEGEEQAQYDDVFGNQALYYVINKPYTRLEISCKSQIAIYEKLPDSRSPLVRKTSIPLAWMPWQRQMMSAYLLPPELPEANLKTLIDFAMSFVERNDYNLIQTLRDMNLRLYQDFTYEQGSTSLTTTPYDVFVSRKGVCQDFANLFICLARLLGIPARYRMGYIYTGAEYTNKIQSDASHAWVETYLPFLGWKGFDPTNGCMAEQNHIRVACGRNYRDATPTTGTIYKGGGNESLTISVKVKQI